MFEKVNPKHPDKVADTIAGAIVDLAYKKKPDPKIAVEVLTGHGYATVIIESDVVFTEDVVREIVWRNTSDKVFVKLIMVPQDVELAKNQENGMRCGDNGIFKGMPVTEEQKELTRIAKDLYTRYPSDGKYVLAQNYNKLIICQSNASNAELNRLYPMSVINPLGEWTGGIDVDSGATNRKLGSDMGDGVTGGGLMGKDLSKADVSVNIYCHLLAQELKKPVEAFCAIGDENVIVNEKLIPFAKIVEVAREYIKSVGGFENFAKWGLIR